MTERLKEDMFKDGTADLIVGLDAYRDIPRLIHALSPIPVQIHTQQQHDYEHGYVQYQYQRYQQPIMEYPLNVELSFDETYADITPIHKNNSNNKSNIDTSTIVPVMRECNNMCSYRANACFNNLAYIFHLQTETILIIVLPLFCLPSHHTLHIEEHTFSLPPMPSCHKPYFQFQG